MTHQYGDVHVVIVTPSGFHYYLSNGRNHSIIQRHFHGRDIIPETLKDNMFRINGFQNKRGTGIFIHPGKHYFDRTVLVKNPIAPRHLCIIGIHDIQVQSTHHIFHIAGRAHHHDFVVDGADDRPCPLDGIQGSRATH